MKIQRLPVLVLAMTLCLPVLSAQAEEASTPEISAQSAVVLTAADGQAFRMTLPAGCGPVELLHRAHSNHAGEMEDVTLIRFAAPAAGSAASCRVTICPV